jgi:hypothetical protein
VGIESYQVNFRVPINYESFHNWRSGIDLESIKLNLVYEEPMFCELVYDDGNHIIELRFTSNPDNEITISFRFALCNYDSIDEVFLELLKSVSQRIVNDFGVGEIIEQKDEEILAAIKKQRTVWQKIFGNKQFPSNCDSAIQNIERL